jgi:hypothetical protein
MQERRKVSVYDPVFTGDDVELLRDLQLNCLRDNTARHRLSRRFDGILMLSFFYQQVKYPLLKPTMLFMPHCDRNLYENILRENWTRARLRNMLLIANRFSEYVDK